MVSNCRLFVFVLALAGCGESDDPPKGNPVAINCGIEGGPGNELGIGKYCLKTSDCPIAQAGTSIQCSTALVDESLPLMCSRLCDLTAADPGCGTNAKCTSVLELGFDLVVCVPLACQPLFSMPL